MERILALDISSSTIGWAVLELDDNQVVTLPKMGYIKPPNKAKGSLSKRINYVFEEIEKLILEVKPTDVVAEDYARKFSKGRSSANTIILLSVFNETCSLVSYRILHRDVFKYPVVSIRAVLGRYFGLKIISKDDIFPVIQQHCHSFTPEKNKNGGIKNESGDIADAIAVGITYFLKENKVISSWSI